MPEQDGRRQGVPAAQGAEEVVVAGEVVLQAAGPQPARDGAAAPLGKEEPGQQRQQSPGGALVEEGGHAGGEGLPQQGEQGYKHGGLSWPETGACNNPDLGGRAPASPSKTLSPCYRKAWILSESAVRVVYSEEIPPPL